MSCPHTGLGIPECSCPECIRKLIEAQAPNK